MYPDASKASHILDKFERSIDEINFTFAVRVGNH
jgi:hypothetical protein